MVFLFHIYVGLPMYMHVYTISYILMGINNQKNIRMFIYSIIAFYWDSHAIRWICWNRNSYHDHPSSEGIMSHPASWKHRVTGSSHIFLAQKMTYSQQVLYQLYLTWSDYSQESGKESPFAKSSDPVPFSAPKSFCHSKMTWLPPGVPTTARRGHRGRGLT